MSSTENAVATLQAHLDPVINQAVAEQRIIGGVLLVAHKGEVIYHRAAGFADREAAVPMREDAIFRLSSLTKPIVSATALALVERGLLSLDHTVSRWISEFRPALPDGTVPEIKIRELLSHTAGLGYSLTEPPDGPYHKANISSGLDQPGLAIAENLQRIASLPLSYKPNTSWGYSIAHDVLGEVIARARKSSLPEAVSRFVTAPLAMRDTSFSVIDPSRLVVPYGDGSPKPVRMDDFHVVNYAYGSISFAPLRPFDPRSYPSGGTGMNGTAADFLKFLEVVRTGGDPILSGESVKAMTSNQSSGFGPQPGVAFGYGLSVVTDPQSAGTPQSARTYAWGGVYGHSWFVDPLKQLTVVNLTNTAVEGLIGQYPVQVRNAIYAYLAESE
jgi:CubicO group peptidase (beta-lactamase class C family)